MEKVRPWCGQPSDRGRLRNRNRNSETALCIILTRSGFSENCRPFQCASFFFFYIPENDILETLLRTQAVRSLPTVTRQDDKRVTPTRTTTSRRSSRHFTDFQFVGEWSATRRRCWYGSVCTTQCHVTWPTSVCRRRLRTVVASLALQSPPGALDSDVYWPAQLCLLWH